MNKHKAGGKVKRRSWERGIIENYVFKSPRFIHKIFNHRGLYFSSFSSYNR